MNLHDAQQSFRQAVAFFNQGHLAEAENCCLRIIEQDPAFADAWDLRAAIARQRGNMPKAVEFLDQAIGIQPHSSRLHLHLGITLQLQQRIPEATASVQRSIALQPGLAEAHFYLGSLYKDQGLLEDAIRSYQRATELRQGFFEALFNLGRALQKAGRLAESTACLREARKLQPKHALTHYELGVGYHLQGLHHQAIASYTDAIRVQPGLENAHLNLANALIELGRPDDAIAVLERGTQTLPQSAQILNNLGFALHHMGLHDRAVDCLHKSIQLAPEATAFNNLGNALSAQGLLDEAVTAFQEAIRLKPDFAGAISNLGNALKDQGLLDEAIEAYRKALALEPKWVEVHSNLLCTINPHASMGAKEIYEEHIRWDSVHARPLAKCIHPHPNDRSPDRPLRIGYVSPDFVGAPVGRFILPILEAHDHSDCSVFCYSSVRRPDQITQACQRSAVWRQVLGQSDEAVARIIRQDKIDILVDLTMHMMDHRLLVFARKPAPVQATYLAYCGTTGLSTMDYRLTDPYLDSPGQNDEFYSEKSVYLPDCYWCYRPVPGTPDTRPRPGLTNEVITFGCLNNFCKVTSATLAVWSQLLHVVSNSRLLLHAQHGSHRKRVCTFLESQGISSDRVEFVPMLPGFDYFRRYHDMDIALDTFPFCGGTTTCDALWMGVPVVTLAGKRAVTRSGLSLLSNIGLSELVATNTAEYVSLASELALDLDRLNSLSAALRDRMLASPLMDARNFTRNLEAAYRRMWIAFVEPSRRVASGTDLPAR